MNLFYEIELLEKPVQIGDRSYPRSVKVVEILNRKKIRERYLGVVDKEEIYSRIEKREAVHYENVYIRDFSLTEYRRSRNLAEESDVAIANFELSNCILDCDALIDFSYALFEGHVDMNKTIFYHGTLDFSHAHFNGGFTDFTDCKFHTHNAIFQYAEFAGDRLSFERTDFTVELVSFINTTFKSETVNFKRVLFNECKVKFHFAEFGDGLKTFEKMKFFGSVLDFRRVIWGSGKIDFRRSIFGKGHITFEEMELDNAKMTFRLSIFEGGELTFRRTNFGKEGEINLDHCKFGNRAISFEGCLAQKISITNSDIHSSLDLRIKKTDIIDLSSSYLHAITDLNFNKKDALKQLIIVEVRNLGKIIIHWDKNNVKELITSQDCSDDEKADQFNIIKDNFTQNGQYSDEDWAYVNFKRYEHKVNLRKLREKLGRFAFLANIVYFFRKLVFDHIGLFATSPNRVLGSMIVVILGFATIYAVFGLLGVGEIINSVGALDQLNLFEKSVYHSAITFFTIGYGDFYPTSFNRTVSAMEGWTGVFMMSYFTVAFVRKILR